MKKLLTIVTLFIASTCVFAQTPPTKPNHLQLPKPLLTQLKLTPDQQAKVTAILKNKNQQIDSLIKLPPRRNQKLYDAKLRSVNTEANDQLYGVFNEDQKHVYAQWLLDRRTKMQNKKPVAAVPAG
jgi:hypothetical protein